MREVPKIFKKVFGGIRMTPEQRCHAEIAEALATHHDFAYKVAIWQLDWLAELWLIQREAAHAL